MSCKQILRQNALCNCAMCRTIFKNLDFFLFSSCVIHSNVEKQKKFEHINNDLKGQDDISTDGCSTMVLYVDGMGLDGSLGGVRFRAAHGANNCPMKYTFANSAIYWAI